MGWALAVLALWQAGVNEGDRERGVGLALGWAGLALGLATWLVRAFFGGGGGAGVMAVVDVGLFSRVFCFFRWIDTCVHGEIGIIER